VPGEGVTGFRPDRFRAARKKAGLSQKQLAARLHVSQSQVSDWERGTVNPRARNLHAAAALLDVPVDELLDVDTAPTLRQLRQRAGLSQRELASALAVSQQAYHKLEHGTVALRPDAAAILADLLGVPADDVLVAWRRTR
jgi:transcriptional regulator with XRE-family HTH domain